MVQQFISKPSTPGGVPPLLVPLFWISMAPLLIITILIVVFMLCWSRPEWNLRRPPIVPGLGHGCQAHQISHMLSSLEILSYQVQVKVLQLRDPKITHRFGYPADLQSWIRPQVSTALQRMISLRSADCAEAVVVLSLPTRHFLLLPPWHVASLCSHAGAPPPLAGICTGR